MSESTSSSRTPSVPVLLGGLLTTALALAGVWWLAHNADDFNVMNWYAWFILPIGPLLVGLVAGSGYGLASWFTGFRVGKATLAVVVVLQLIAYGLAQYIDYLEIVETYSAYPPSFVQFFDEVTRSISFQSDDFDSTGPLGALGYGVRLLEVLGFVGGALMILAGLRGRAYCDDCGTYMKTDSIVSIPASATGKAGMFAGKEKKAAHAEASEAAYQSGATIHDALFAQVGQGDAEGFSATVQQIRTSGKLEKGKPMKGMPRLFVVNLTSCPSCRQGNVSSVLRTVNGQDVHDEPVSSLPVTSEFVQAAQL
ncbi:MAG: hypothetical protein Rubg2KO_14700 [Rubricoccaceae bacterium]